MSVCFICNYQNAYITDLGDWDHSVNCRNCGKYIITSRATDSLTDDNKIKLSSLLRERFLKGLNPIAIFKEKPNYQDISQSHIKSPIMTIDELLNTFPNKVSDRLDRTLVNLAASSNYPGDKVQIINGEFSNFFRQTNNTNEIHFFLRQLSEDRLISGSLGVIPTTIQVTSKGWNRIAELEKRDIIKNSQAFVAMWFNAETDSAYHNGIKKAVEAAGYDAIRIDKVEHNNKIDDEIIAKIRESKFIIADFTGHRGGVYFEAGFAMGLGKPVIWTCRYDDLENLHFDTRQYSHILWENETDLYEKLYNRIRATI